MSSPRLAKQREHEIAHEMGTCIHFLGIQHAECKVLVNIRELVGGSDFGWAVRIPCIIKDGSAVVCDRRELRTREQAEAMVDEHKAQFERSMKAVTAAHAHAKTQGFGVGNGGRGELPCPLGCDGGVIRYSVAGVNGHMHAACTKGCTSWME